MALSLARPWLHSGRRKAAAWLTSGFDFVVQSWTSTAHGSTHPTRLAFAAARGARFDEIRHPLGNGTGDLTPKRATGDPGAHRWPIRRASGRSAALRIVAADPGAGGAGYYLAWRFPAWSVVLSHSAGQAAASAASGATVCRRAWCSGLFRPAWPRSRPVRVPSHASGATCARRSTSQRAFVSDAAPELRSPLNRT